MDIRQAFQSSFLRAAEMQGPQAVTIKSAAVESLGDVQKPVVRFKEISQGLVLNRTNARVLSQMFGPETDSWVGKRLTLFVASVEFRGRQVPGIRIKPSAPQPQTRAPEPPPDDFYPEEYQEYSDEAA
jgi:hypothetical protein